MRLLPLFFLLLLLPVGAVAAEPIDELVTRLSADHGWMNGGFPSLHLSEKTPPEKIVGKLFERLTFPAGRVKHFTVVKQQQVRLPGPLPDVYTAILVQTDLGTKIVLLQYYAPPIEWWSQVHDVPPA